MSTLPEFELKVLRTVHDLERDTFPAPVMSEQVAPDLPDDDPVRVDHAVERLWRAGYIEGHNEPMMDRRVSIMDLKVSAEGLRELEEWPREPSLETLLAALHEAEAATEDEDERRGLQRMREGAKRLTAETAWTIYRAWIGHLGGPGGLAG